MDKMLYIAMGGARQLLQAQAINSHNLANVNTTGFKADLQAFQGLALQGQGQASRVYTVDQGMGTDLAPGAQATTGRDLDVALRGPGFIAVQASDGGEAYTRAGDLRLNANGLLQTGAGHLVLGENGPISVPPASKLEIGSDGTISIVPLGQNPNTMTSIDRIRLVNPATSRLAKGEDGLLRLPADEKAEPDAGVQLATGVLESSNVSATGALVDMIQLARQYEMQVKVMKTAEDNDAAATQLMRLT
jgi:flagellar basal-body rod protein FlgF